MHSPFPTTRLLCDDGVDTVILLQAVHSTADGVTIPLVLAGPELQQGAEIQQVGVLLGVVVTLGSEGPAGGDLVLGPAVMDYFGGTVDDVSQLILVHLGGNVGELHTQVAEHLVGAQSGAQVGCLDLFGELVVGNAVGVLLTGHTAGHGIVQPLLVGVAGGTLGVGDHGGEDGGQLDAVDDIYGPVGIVQSLDVSGGGGDHGSDLGSSKHNEPFRTSCTRLGLATKCSHFYSN